MGAICQLSVLETSGFSAVNSKKPNIFPDEVDNTFENYQFYNGNRMINSQGVSEQLEKLYEEYKQIAREVYVCISDFGTNASLLRDLNLLTEFPDGQLCYVKEGYLKMLRGNREIRMFSGGDFVVTTGNWPEEFKIVSDFKSDLVVFASSDLLKYAGENPDFRDKWAVLTEKERRLHLCLCGEFAPEVVDFEMVVKNFSKGDVIINPDEPNQAVYEMISGSADVFLNDLQVGTIGNNEMFGEIEYLSPGSVKAKVVARKNCFVRILEPELFTYMIENNSQFAVTLLRNLASRINALNDTLVSLESNPSRDV